MSHYQDCVFELLTEELPPKDLYNWAQQLVDSVSQQLHETDLAYTAVRPVATPRRLGVYIDQLACQQPAQRVQKKGPAVNVAYDNEGQPTQAAVGFARSCGVELEQLTVYETNKGRWLYLDQEVEGYTAGQLLPDILKQAVEQLPVNKMMYWGQGHHAFMRPVHNVLALYGSETLVLNLFSHQAQAYTYGHRFHSPQAVPIEQASQYVDKLYEHYVLVDFAKRRQSIAEQARRIAEHHQAKLVMPEALLDEVTSMVEWPVALQGRFDQRFLAIPQEVLILSMQSNQKYFALLDQNEQLLPYFITISHIESRSPETVIKGNERVIQARLADAEFFYQVDQQRALADYVPELASITFQKDLGTLADKQKRLKTLTRTIANKLGWESETVERAAGLAKADLVTDMVQEFSELQGTMGRYYALASGENETVAQAIEEHYQPRHADDILPQSKAGQVLALADRLDTLVGLFGVNMKPSADKDPYALRRAALACVRLLITKQLPLDLFNLLEAAFGAYGQAMSNTAAVDEVFVFCQERLKTWALDHGYQHEVYAAVAVKNITCPLEFAQRMQAVTEFQKLPQAHSLAQANKRVSNILSKSGVQVDQQWQADALQQDAEQELAQAVERHQAMTDLTFTERLYHLAQLQPSIDRFFDEVMVNTDDPSLKQNRLALLKAVRELFLQVADISYLPG